MVRGRPGEKCERPGWAQAGLLDTNIMILRSRIAPQELPDEMAISAVTLAELSTACSSRGGPGSGGDVPAVL